MKFLERFWFGCGHCHAGEGCPLLDEGANLESLHSGRVGGLGLVLTVILVFILPLVTAIGGAMLADHWWAGNGDAVRGAVQAGGGAVGFFVGVALAKLAFWLRRRCSPSQEDCEMTGTPQGAPDLCADHHETSRVAAGLRAGRHEVSQKGVE